jgi:predicted ATP-dependent serine protease
MQLLEKDPEKRPESASVVLQALEAIKAGKIKKEPSKESPAPENPLYRRVFVGREPELKQLQNAFDGAMSGQGALMMVMGEPGIGKSTLTMQIANNITQEKDKTVLYVSGEESLEQIKLRAERLQVKNGNIYLGMEAKKLGLVDFLAERTLQRK